MFVIDTSSIIHAWKRDYPPDSFPTLWTRVEGSIGAGEIIAPDEVHLELQRGGDDIYEWAKEQSGFFVEPDDEAQEVVRRIVDDWPDFVPDESHDGVWADPYVIALAYVKKATVVTGENLVPPEARRPKMPNICQKLDVLWVRLLDLIRAKKWSF